MAGRGAGLKAACCLAVKGRRSRQFRNIPRGMSLHCWGWRRADARRKKIAEMRFRGRSALKRLCKGKVF